MREEINLRDDKQTTLFFDEDITVKQLVTTKGLVIMDDNVASFYYDEFKNDFDVLILPAGEKSKSFDNYLKIISYLFKNGYNRSDYLIAVGGGVITDLTAFSASNYKRGMNLILVPTSLMGMVDASIGGKTAIDYQNVKNIVGSFYLPQYIVVDFRFLKTLPKKEYSNGLAEILKIGMVADEEIYQIFLKNEQDASIKELVKRAIKVKFDFVKKDLHDQNIRHALNFGHTFGHALESYYHISHGQAVALGMLIVSQNKDYFSDLKKIVLSIGLKNSFTFDAEGLMTYLSQDKKRTEKGIELIEVEKVGTYSHSYKSLKELYDLVSGGRI